MKKLRNVIGLLVLFGVSMFLLTGCQTKYEQETDPHKYLEFQLQEDQTYRVIGFKKGFIQHVQIPSEHQGLKVTHIASYAFRIGQSFFGIGPRHLPIETLVIEEGITHIGEEAFLQNGLKSVQLPQSLVYLGESAFSDNETTINYPNNLAYIGAYAFLRTKLEGSLHLKNIEFGYFAFGYTHVTEVFFEEGFTHITENLFYGASKLERVHFPESLTTIQEDAFAYTPSLKEINIPAKLDLIKARAFYHSGIQSLIFDHPLSIEERAFSENESLSVVTFNHPEITLGAHAFGANKSLNEVHFNDLVNINPEAFVASPMNQLTIANDNSSYQIINNALTKTINDEVVLVIGGSEMKDLSMFDFIGNHAFGGKDLGEFHIPANIQSIGSNAFAFARFDQLRIDSLEISSKAFYYAQIQGVLEISSKLIHPQSFYYAKGFLVLKLLEGVETIKREAFVVNTDLEEVYLPNSLKIIEMAGFLQCHNLKDVYYGLKSGTPADIYIGSFLIMKSNTVVNHRVQAKIYPDFKIHVEPEVIDLVKEHWKRVPDQEYYIYEGDLLSHIFVNTTK